MVIARRLTIHRHSSSVATQGGNELAHDLLGIERSAYFQTDRLSTLLDRSPAKAQHVALAIVLGACESVTNKQTWRAPSPADADYFIQLAAWGYTLSEVEQIVVGGQTMTDAEDAGGSGRRAD